MGSDLVQVSFLGSKWIRTVVQVDPSLDTHQEINLKWGTFSISDLTLRLLQYKLRPFWCQLLALLLIKINFSSSKGLKPVSTTAKKI